MTHSFTYILETIQAKTLKILTLKSISKMHFKCNLCFFMCLWCHYHLLSTEFQHRVCFHTGTASEGTLHVPRPRQVTPSNYSPGQDSKKSGLTDTWLTLEPRSPMTTVLLVSHRHHAPTQGFLQQCPEQNGLQREFLVLPVPGRDVAGAGTTATSALSTAAETPGRGLATRAPFTSTGQTSRTELQHLKGWNGERKPRQSHVLQQHCRGKNPTLHFQTIYCIMSWYVTKYISGYSEDQNL